LRERRDDIGRLFFHFLREELAIVGEEHRLTAPGPEAQPWPPAAWIARLAVAAWPGEEELLTALVANRARPSDCDLTRGLHDLTRGSSIAAGESRRFRRTPECSIILWGRKP